MKTLALCSLLALATQVANAWDPLAAVSWTQSQISVFFSNERKLWHKYYTRDGWHPFEGRFERLSCKISSDLSHPATVSWADNRSDIFLYDTAGRTWHKYWDGYNWQPKSLEQLSKPSKRLKFTGKLSATSWGHNRIDVAGMVMSNKSTEEMMYGTYVHLYWDGSQWAGWEEWPDQDFLFTTSPTIISWDSGRFDVFGVDENENVRHKFWDGDEYNEGWELLDKTVCDEEGSDCDPPDGLKSNSVSASSWNVGRLDVWAVGNDAQLWHAYWIEEGYHPWEPLGGSFEEAPKVVHWGKDRIDIVGFGGTQGDSYWYKYGFWDGSNWHWKPSVEDWYEKSIDGGFASEPVITSWGEGNLNIVGLDAGAKLRWQMWNETEWYPGYDEWEDLGNPLERQVTAGMQQLLLSDDHLEDGHGFKKEM